MVGEWKQSGGGGCKAVVLRGLVVDCIFKLLFYVMMGRTRQSSLRDCF